MLTRYHGDAQRLRRSLLAGLGAIAGVDPNHPALKNLERASAVAFKEGLRADPRLNTIRDNQRGEIQRPCHAPEPWDPEESMFYLERVIWCDAVRRYNHEKES